MVVGRECGLALEFPMEELLHSVLQSKPNNWFKPFASLTGTG